MDTQSTTTTLSTDAEALVHSSSISRRLFYHLSLPLILLIIATGLRLYRLDVQSVMDDTSILNLSAASLTQCLSALREYMPENTRLFYVFQYYWGHLVGLDPYHLRLFNVLLNVLSVLVLYGLGYSIRGRTTGFIAGFCIALSPMQIYHAQSLTPYALLVLCVTISFYTFWKMIRHNSYAWGILNVILNLGIVWTHMDALFIVFAQWCALLVLWYRTPKRIIQWTFAHAVTNIPTALHLLFLPKMDITGFYEFFQPATFRSFMAILFGMDSVNINTEFTTMILKPWPWLNSIHFDFLSIVYQAGYILAALNIVCFTSLFFTLLRRRNLLKQSDSQLQALGTFLLFFLIPPICLAVISYTWRPYFFPRYMLSTHIAMCLLVGLALDTIPWRRMKKSVIAALILLLCAQFSVVLPGTMRTDWHSLTRHIYAHASENDLVLLGGDMCLQHYVLNAPDQSLPVLYIPISHVYDHIPDMSVDARSAASISRRYLNQVTNTASVWFVYVQLYKSGPLPEMESRLREAGLECIFTEFLGGENIKLYRIYKSEQLTHTDPPPPSTPNPVTRLLGNVPDIHKAQAELKRLWPLNNFLMGSLTPLFSSIQDPKVLQQKIAPIERAGLLEHAGIILHDYPMTTTEAGLRGISMENNLIISETQLFFFCFNPHLASPRFQTLMDLLMFLKEGTLSSPAPTAARTYLEEGVSMRAVWFYKKAADQFERGLRYNPTNLELLTSLATAKVALGDDAGALNAINQACGLDAQLAEKIRPFMTALFVNHDSTAAQLAAEKLSQEIILAPEWLRKIRQLNEMNSSPQLAPIP